MDTESQPNNSNSEDFDTSFSESDTSESGSSNSIPSPVLQFDHLSQPYIAVPVDNTKKGTNTNPPAPTALLELKNHCEVCYSNVSPDFIQEDTKRLFEIVYCKDCYAPAHLICYGLSTQLEEESHPSGRRIKVYQCDRCKNPEERDAACYVCSSKEGCLRHTKDDKWLHIPCGMGSTHISFEDLTNMSIDMSGFKKETSKLRAVKKCDLCKIKVETFKCVNEHSVKHCHVHCALRAAHLDPKNNLWRAYFSLTSQEGLPVHEKLDDQAVLANLEDVAYNLREVIEDSDDLKKSYEPLMNLKPRKAPKGQKGKKKMSKEDAQVTNFLTRMLHKAQKRAEERFKGKIPEDVLKKREDDEYCQQVGGKVVLVHKLEAPKEAKAMEVEEEKKESTNEDNPNKKIIREFNKEINSLDVLLEPYSDGRHSKLRSDLRDFPNMQRISFPEVLFFANVFQKRMEAAWNNLCSSDILKHLIMSAKMIPFTLERLLKPLNEKYCTGIAADILLKPCFQTVKPESAYSVKKRVFKEDIIRKNHISIEQAVEVQKLYLRESCGILTKSYENLEKYHEQLIFLGELYGKLGEYYKENERLEPEKSIVVKLYEKAKELELDKDLAEMKLLEGFVVGPRIDEDVQQEEDNGKKGDRMEEEKKAEKVKGRKESLEDMEEETTKVKKSKEGKEKKKGNKENKKDNKEESDQEEGNKKKEKKAKKMEEQGKQKIIETSEDLFTVKNKKKALKLTEDEELSYGEEKEEKNEKKVLKKQEKEEDKRGHQTIKSNRKDSGESELSYKIPPSPERKDEDVMEIIEDNKDIERDQIEEDVQEIPAPITVISAASILPPKISPNENKKTSGSVEDEKKKSASGKNKDKSPEKTGSTKKEDAQKKSAEKRFTGEVEIEEQEEREQKGTEGKGTRRGRPPKSEKVVSEIEEDFQREMKALNKKVSKEEAQKARDNKELQQQLKKALEWKEKYEEYLEMRNRNLKELIEQVSEIRVRVPEMSHALEQKRLWRLWKNKATDLNRRLKKKTENSSEENEDMVNIEDLEKVLKEADALKYIEADEVVLKELKTKLSNASKIREKFQAPGQMGLLSHLKEAERKLRAMNIKIPEFNVLKHKLDANYNVQRLLEDSLPLEKLEEALEELGKETDSVDAGLYSLLSMKVSQGKKIREESKVYLKPGKEHKLGELGHMAYLLREAEINKVQISELEEVRALVESFLLLSNVYGILYDVQPLDFDSLEAGDLLGFKGKSLVELVLACEKMAKGDGLQNMKESKIESLKEYCAKFSEIEEKCKGRTFRDSMFPLIFKSVSLVLTKKPAVKTPKPQTSVVVEERSNSYRVEPEKRMEEEKESYKPIRSEDRETYKPIRSVDKLKEWKDQVHEFLRRSPEETLVEMLDSASGEELAYERMFEELETLRKEAENLVLTYVMDIKKLDETKELIDQSRALQKISRWVDWSIEALKAKRQLIDEKQQLEASQIKSLVQKMDELKLPKSSGLCRIVLDWNKTLESAMKEFDKINPASKLGKSLKTSFEDVGKLKVKEIIERTKDSRVDAEELARIKIVLKKADKIVKMSKEIEQIEKDAVKYDKWADAVQELAEQYMQYKDDDLAVKEKMSTIRKGMERLKKELYGFNILQESDEVTFRLLEWMVKSGDLTKGEEKVADYESWNEILEEVDEFGEIEGDGGRVARLKDWMKKEIEKAKNLKNLIKNLKEGQKLSLVDLKRWLDCAVKCKVKLEEEQKTLEKTQRECVEVKEKVERFLGSCKDGRKSRISEFKEILQKIKVLPLKLFDEEEKLTTAIKLGESIQKDAQKLEKENREGKSNTLEMKVLIERYRVCPVYVQEVEDMQKGADQSRLAGKFVKTKLEELAGSEKKVSFQELVQVEKKLSEMVKSGQNKENENSGDATLDKEVRMLRKEIFVRKCEILRGKISDGVGREEASVMNVKEETLKELLMEGERLTRLYKDDYKLMKCVATLKDIARKVEETMEKIGRARSAEELERIPRYVLGILDISDQIDKRKEEVKSRKGLGGKLLSRENSNREPFRYEVDKEDRRDKDREREEEKRKGTFHKLLSKEVPNEPPKKIQGTLLGLFKKEEARKNEDFERSPKKKKGEEEKKRHDGPPSWLREQLRSPPKINRFSLEDEKPRKSSKEELRERIQSKSNKALEGEKGKKNKEVVKTQKDKHSILAELKDLLEANEYVELSLLDYLEYSRAIISCCPEMQEKPEAYTKVMRQMRSLLKCEFILKSLIERKFEKVYLKSLIELDDTGIRMMEEKLQEKLNPKEKMEKMRISEREKEYDIYGDKYKEEKTVASKKQGSPESHVMTPYRAGKEDSALDGAGNNDHTSTASTTLAKNDGENSTKKPSVGLKAVSNTGQEAQIAKRLAFEKYNPESTRLEKSPEKKRTLNLETAKPVEEKKVDEPMNKVQDTMPRQSPLIQKYVSSKQGTNVNQEEPTIVAQGNGTAKVTKDAEVNRKDQSPEKPRDLIQLPQGAVLKIFEGSIKYVELNKEYQMIGLYTIDAYSVVTSLPEIADKEQAELKIEGKLSQNRFEEYLNKIFSMWEKKTEKVMSGWVESSISIYQNRCEQIAQELVETKKVSMAGYHESSKIFFLHKNQMPENWKSKLNFSIKKLRKNSNPSLCYIIVHKPYKLKAQTKLIKPDIVLSVEADQGTEGQTYSVKPSPHNEGEADFGAEVYNEEVEELNESVEMSNRWEWRQEAFTNSMSMPYDPEYRLNQSNGIEDRIAYEPVIIESKENTVTMNQVNVEKIMPVQEVREEKEKKDSYEGGKRSFEAMYGKDVIAEKSPEKKIKLDQQKSSPMNVNRLGEEQQKDNNQENVMGRNQEGQDAVKTVSPRHVGKVSQEGKVPEKPDVIVIKDEIKAIVSDWQEKVSRSKEEVRNMEQAQPHIIIVNDEPQKGTTLMDPVEIEDDAVEEINLQGLQEDIEVEELLVEKLQEMDQSQLYAYAKGLDKNQRESIIQILQEARHKSRSVSSKPPSMPTSIQKTVEAPIIFENTVLEAVPSFGQKDVSDFNYKVPKMYSALSTYTPPHYIQRIYDLFTAVQLEEASKKITTCVARKEDAWGLMEGQNCNRPFSTVALGVPAEKKASNIITTAETSPNNSRNEERKVEERSLDNMQVEREIRMIGAENEAKFLSLKASACASSVNKSAKVSPKCIQETELVSHNPIIRQQLRNKEQKENSSVNGEVSTSKDHMNQNEEGLESVNLIEEIGIPGIKIDGQNITFPKELYDQLMSIGSIEGNLTLPLTDPMETLPTLEEQNQKGIELIEALQTLGGNFDLAALNSLLFGNQQAQEEGNNEEIAQIVVEQNNRPSIGNRQEEEINEDGQQGYDQEEQQEYGNVVNYQEDNIRQQEQNYNVNNYDQQGRNSRGAHEQRTFYDYEYKVRNVQDDFRRNKSWDKDPAKRSTEQDRKSPMSTKSNPQEPVKSYNENEMTPELQEDLSILLDLKNLENLKEKLNFYASNLEALANQGIAKLSHK